MATRAVAIQLHEAPRHARELDAGQLLGVAWAMGIPTDGKRLDEIRRWVEAWPVKAGAL